MPAAGAVVLSRPTSNQRVSERLPAFPSGIQRTGLLLAAGAR